jgi:hypothetical protein
MLCPVQSILGVIRRGGVTKMTCRKQRPKGMQPWTLMCRTFVQELPRCAKRLETMVRVLIQINARLASDHQLVSCSCEVNFAGAT